MPRSDDKHRLADPLPHDLLGMLRATLRKLETQAYETPRLADLKRVLKQRIADLEQSST